MKVLVMALGVVGVVGFSVGCSAPSVDEVCGHIAEVAEKEGKALSDDDKKQCISEVGEDLKECKNGKEIGKCLMDVESMSGVSKCRDMCKK